MPEDNRKFSSNLPDHLLTNASPESKWLMENISILTQKTDYILEKQEAQGNELKEIKAECKKTNGRVSKHDSILEPITDITEDLKKMVNTRKLIGKLVKSKYTWAAGGFFIVGIYTVFTSPILLQWLARFF